MLRQVSMQADDPQRVATVIAELWGGRAFPFPRASDDAWIAMADDGCATMLEVLPRGTELREGDGAEEPIGVSGPAHRFTSCRIAMDTVLEAAAVFAIGQREGWRMKYLRRGNGAFRVIEAWIEGCSMVELVTPGDRTDYLQALTVEHCRSMQRL